MQTNSNRGHDWARAQRKSAGRLPIGDKHKTSRPKSCFLTFWSDWLVTSSRWRLELDNSQSRNFLFLNKKLLGMIQAVCIKPTVVFLRRIFQRLSLHRRSYWCLLHNWLGL